MAGSHLGFLLQAGRERGQLGVGPGRVGEMAGIQPKHLPLTLSILRPQIDSFELLYYYDEYLGHSMW